MHRARLVALAAAAHRSAAATAAPRAVDDLRQRSAGAHAGLQDTPRMLQQSGQRGVGEARRAAPTDRRAARTAPRSARRCRCPPRRSGRAAPRRSARDRGERARARSTATGICGSSSSRSGPRLRSAGWRATRARSSNSSTGPPNCTAARPLGAQRQPCAARCAAPRLALAVDVPGAGHAQVGVQERPSVERSAGGACRAPRPTRARGRRAAFARP